MRLLVLDFKTFTMKVTFPNYVYIYYTLFVKNVENRCRNYSKGSDFKI